MMYEPSRLQHQRSIISSQCSMRICMLCCISLNQVSFGHQSVKPDRILLSHRDSLVQGICVSVRPFL